MGHAEHSYVSYYLHEKRRDQVMERLDQNLDKDEKFLGNYANKEAWRDASYMVLASVFNRLDMFRSTAGAAHSARDEVISFLLDEGLVPTQAVAEEEYNRLHAHGVEVTCHVHATDDQRTRLQRHKREVPPIDGYDATVHEIMDGAQAHLKWQQAVRAEGQSLGSNFNQASKPFWNNHKNTKIVRGFTTKDHAIGDKKRKISEDDVVEAVYRLLADDHLDLPTVSLPLSNDSSRHADIITVLEAEGALEPAINVFLLRWIESEALLVMQELQHQSKTNKGDVASIPERFAERMQSTYEGVDRIAQEMMDNQAQQTLFASNRVSQENLFKSIVNRYLTADTGRTGNRGV